MEAVLVLFLESGTLPIVLYMVHMFTTASCTQNIKICQLQEVIYPYVEPLKISYESSKTLETLTSAVVTTMKMMLQTSVTMFET